MKQKITKEEALKKAMSICSKQEKCKFDIKDKLFKLGLDNLFITEIIEQLENENFINQDRYCKVYVRDKYKINKWGRKKIIFHLKQKQIDYKTIQKSLLEINEKLYEELAKKEIIKKHKTIKTNDDIHKQKIKLINFALSRGYENEMIIKIINKVT